MNITIDLDIPTPIFTQLIQQIKEAVAQGGLSPGDPLPSIRQLANDLEVNNKTISKAYKLLERDGVIQSRGYRGTFVHQNARESCLVNLNGWVEEKFTQLIVELKQAGITDAEMRTTFNRVLGNL
ncbi:GntR family transcriptional regulator [Agaribacter flavus]|uniref:GntR family transcriptional regulator n=1 Tax=Agaribacter flavus TaxID=1902781 RepID=A0ABV7FPJ9_9ALTE